MMKSVLLRGRLRQMIAIVFVSFLGLDAVAQDTITVTYEATFERGTTYCYGDTLAGDSTFYDWVNFLDEIEGLDGTGDYQFIEAKYSTTDGVSSKEHTFTGTDATMDAFVSDLYSLDTAAAMGSTDTSVSYMSGADLWYITSGCSAGGPVVAGCGAGAYPRIGFEINPSVAFGCNASVESALRPAVGNSSWGGSFGATVPQSVSTSGNDETITFTLRYVDAAKPIPVCYTDTVDVYLDALGGYMVQVSDVDSFSYDEFLNPTLPGVPTKGWGIETYTLSSTLMTCDSTGSRDIMLTIVDSAGNDSSCVTVINVLDTLDPIAIAHDTILAYLGADSSVTVDANDINNGSFDNCQVAGLIDVSDTIFFCAGFYPDTITVFDPSGNSSFATTIVHVIDTVNPVVACRADTFKIYVDTMGIAMLIPDSLDGGSTDNDTCAVLTFMSDTMFTCMNVYPDSILDVTLYVEDGSGNIDSCMAKVQVLDTIKPDVMLYTTLEVYLDSMGMAILDSNAFDSATYDCQLDSFALSMDTFDCSFINATNDSNVTVTTYVWDSSMNLDSATSIAIIKDTIAPNVMCMDTFVYLNAMGYAVIDSSYILDTVTDNCSAMLTYSISQDTIRCLDADTAYITLKVVDQFGNADSCVAKVNVRDTIAPVAVANNTSIVYLDSMGNANLDSTFLWTFVDNGSYDNCDFELSAIDSVFECPEEGLNLVTLVATDAAGNTGTDEFFLTVDDTIQPMAVGHNVTVALNDNGMVSIDPSLIDSASWDNCMDNMTFDLSQTIFTCDDLGANTVSFSVQDGNGQADSMDVVVTIIDVTLPTAVSQNITVYLDAMGVVGITPAMVDNGSVDNCGLDSMWVSQDTFRCEDLGNTPITLFVSDSSMNQNSSPAIVTVLDTIAPVVVLQAAMDTLDADGNIDYLDPSIFIASNMDACGSNVEIVSPVDYDCTHVGPNTVTLKFTDPSGNETVASTTLTIVDDEDPKASAMDITVELDATGNVTITPSMINDGSMDNCSALTYGLDMTMFTCAEVGANTVKLYVTDASMNVDSVTATVTVADNMAPMVALQAQTVSLDATGNVTVAATDFDNGTADNCGIDTMMIDMTAFDCSHVGNNTITFTAIDDNGNMSTETTTLTVEDNMNPSVLGHDTTIVLNADGNAIIRAADVDNGSSDNCSVDLSIDMTDFDCTNVGANTVTLMGVDPAGNMASTTVTVTIVDTTSPVAMTQDIMVELDAAGNATITTSMINDGSMDNCSIASYALDVTGFDCSNVGANTVTLTVTDASGNTDTETATVTVADNMAPMVALQAQTVSLNATGSVTVTAADFDNGTADNCGIDTMMIDMMAFDCSHVGNNTITFTAIDDNGNVSTGTTTLTVEDNTNPSVVGQNITVPLNADGNAIISVADVNDGSSDNCSVDLSIDMTDFDCTNVGANTVTLMGVDPAGNSASTTVTVTIADTTSPVAMTQDIMVELDASGNATITTSMINDGSMDNCSIASYALDVTGFNCSNVGANTVTLTVIDASGNTDTETATVTVADNMAPMVALQAQTVSLDATGNVTVTAGDFDNGTADNCGLASMTIDMMAFDCSHVGNNTITFTATDNNGNVSTGTTTLTVEDNMAPIVLGHDTTIALNTDGNAIISVADVNDGSSDNCSLDLSIDMTDFDCTNVGDNTVTLTGVDAAGNMSSTTVVVTIEDNVAPMAIAQDITAELDENGTVTITPSMINQGSSDNCTAVQLFASTTTFDCSDIGPNTVTLNVTDANGNLATANSIVTVVDNMSPVVALQAHTVALDASGNATVTVADFDNGTTDNCGIASMTIDMMAFDCSHVGNNTITFTATDVNGNVSTGTTTLTVEDNTTPSVTAQDITISLNADGNVTIDVDDINLGSFDNCSGLDLSIDMTFFDCTNLGANTVTLTGVDANGNEATATATVTVEDNMNPVAMTQDVTIELDANGNASITTAMINNGSSDNCSDLSFLLSKTDFDCGDVGTNNVILTAIDGSGRIDTEPATVTVVDNMYPMVSLQVDTVNVGINGSASTFGSALITSTSDNCGIASTVISPSSFDCSDLGLNTVTVTVTDDNGNVTVETGYVVVEDNNNPNWLVASLPSSETVESCSDLGVEYTYDMPIASDICGDVDVTLVSGLPSGSLFPVGSTTMMFEAEDNSGNMISHSFTVTVVKVGGGLPTDLPTGVSICENEDPIILSSQAVFTGPGVLTDSVNFDPAQAGAGSHTLNWIFYDGSGCEPTTGTITMTVNPGAITPVIEQTQTYELTAVDAAYATYQWYKNGIELVGETFQTLDISTSGNYQVIVNSNDGCGAISDPYIIGQGDWDEVDPDLVKEVTLDETSVYPNPTTGLITIDFGTSLEEVTIDVVDIRGAKVKSYNNNDFAASTLELDLSELPSAMYNVIIVSGDQVTRKKIVINK